MNLEDYKITFNYHTHTNRNGHGNREASDEEYIEAALNQGITTLGFSEHCPYKYEGENPQRLIRMDYSQLDEYINTIYSLKEKYKDKINILCAFECEYYPEQLKWYQELKERVDYLILGHHFQSNGKDWYCYAHGCDDQKAIEYTNSVLNGLDSGLFAYLAHPEYFFEGTNEITDTFIECAKKICQKSVDLNIPLEINFNGSHYNLKKQEYKNNEEHYGYPNRLFWRIAKDYNVKCVVGLDAHDPIVINNKDLLIKRYGPEVNDLGLNIITEPFIKEKSKN